MGEPVVGEGEPVVGEEEPIVGEGESVVGEDELIVREHKPPWPDSSRKYSARVFFRNTESMLYRQYFKIATFSFVDGNLGYTVKITSIFY